MENVSNDVLWQTLVDRYGSPQRAVMALVKNEMPTLKMRRSDRLKLVAAIQHYDYRQMENWD